MQWPATGRLTSRYGYRTHPIYGDRRLHAGIDIGGGTGTPIFAAEAGTVILAYFSPSYGNLTVVDHGVIDGRSVTTAYAHQSVIGVSEGQRVARGQQIGRLGNTGNSTGPHLHFEVRLEGEPVDPLGWVSPP
jgi:murein DD-endopeptidase MepM/ murein hydrolase activator NlpD